MKKGELTYKGADKMKRAIMLFVFCMTGLVLMAGVSWSEEAAWYDATENWIVRVYTAPAGADYSVTLEVVDTGNNIVTDPIMGMPTNPLQIAGAADSPDVSLAFDEGSSTAYVIYTEGGGGVALQPVPDIVRAAGVIGASPNPVLFGNVAVGSNIKKTVTVTNTGNAPLHLTAIVKPGAPFSITGASTCAGVTPVAAGGSCSIVVKFAPTAVETYNNSFVISSDGGDATVHLNGTGRQ